MVSTVLTFQSGFVVFKSMVEILSVSVPVLREVNSCLEQKVVEILDPFGPSIVDPRLGTLLPYSLYI